MCGRYSITTPVEAMRELFLFTGSGFNLRPRYNAAPTQDLPIVRRNASGGDRELVMLRWGLVPSWAKDIKIGSRLINARAETAAEKPSFRSAMRRRRCLVPADGFYEWKTIDGRIQPFRICRSDGATFAFAGLWERWRPEIGETLETFAVLTTTANRQLHSIHHRMPVILNPEDYARWLDPAAELGSLQQLLKPYDGSLEASPVSSTVNDVRNDTATCFEPDEAAPRLL